ncbi:MAG: PEP/pyruvate-binding domain-containing protein [Dehalococcoidia bacterium]
MTRRHVIPLHDTAAHDPAIAGAKGAALARMIKARLPVPAGFVVTAHAFERGTDGLLSEIEATFAGVDVADLDALEYAYRSARKRLERHELPDDIVGAVHDAHHSMGAPAVAVRSSATAEDLPTASFAGQYDSFLNVLGPAEILQRILHVWASLYSPRAVSYRRQRAIADGDVRMAVVVQELLPAEAAGVLFTRDPMTSDENRYVVNAALGMGEGVVAGEAPADRFGLHPESGAVLDREIATKDYKVTLARRGGLRRVKVRSKEQTAPALREQHLIELASLATSVRGLFEGHQDIEFAVRNGSVHLLQARPVTAVDETPDFPIVWEKPEDANHTWLLYRIPQRGAVPTRRLEQDALRAYYAGSRACFNATGSPLARNHIICFIDGFSYGRGPDVDEAKVAALLQRYGARAQKYYDRSTSIWEEELRPEVEEIVRELERFRPERASRKELVAHMESAMRAYSRVLGDLHWRFAGANISRRLDWGAVYTELTGEPQVDAGVFLQAIENKTTRMIRSLRGLARLVQQDRTLRSIFATRAYERLDDRRVRERPGVRRLNEGFRRLLKRHGRRTGRGFGSATLFDTPTWSMQPEQPLDMIAAYAELELDRLDRLEVEARAERLRQTRRVRRMLAADPTRLARFDRMLSQAQQEVCDMENHNHMMEQATGGAFRESIYFVGRRLVDEGRLDDPDDVLHFPVAELRRIASGRGPQDLRTIVRERQAEHERRLGLRPPLNIGSGGPPPAAPFAIFDLPEGVGLDGKVLRGVAGSRGRVLGKARVVPMTARPPKVEKGAILVAVNAGPNWTPVFPLLGGLVLDQGAVFQHAALVAREYRIPAVIMTRDATSTIRDGQWITVDGDQGIVEL